MSQIGSNMNVNEDNYFWHLKKTCNVSFKKKTWILMTYYIIKSEIIQVPYKNNMYKRTF